MLSSAGIRTAKENRFEEKIWVRRPSPKPKSFLLSAQKEGVNGALKVRYLNCMKYWQPFVGFVPTAGAKFVGLVPLEGAWPAVAAGWWFAMCVVTSAAYVLS